MATGHIAWTEGRAGGHGELEPPKGLEPKLRALLLLCGKLGAGFGGLQ